MRLRYDGTCAGCGTAVKKGERAHYLPNAKQVRCLSCGHGELPLVPTAPAAEHQAPPGAPPPTDAPIELVQGALTRNTRCNDCARALRRGVEALFDSRGRAALCLDCITLDTVHVLGTAGAGARKEHAKRLERHQTRVRTAHPRLGNLILALNDDPRHVRAWQTGAIGEEAFGEKLSSIASNTLKVLHDRKVPRSSANIDHLAVTSEGVWILDAKRYRGKVETRGHGLFSRKPPDLYVGGRNQMKLVAGAQKQVEVVRLLDDFSIEQRQPRVPVRGALVFVGAEFSWFADPLLIQEVWVGWGKAMRDRLMKEHLGQVPVASVAKYLARSLRAG